MTSPTYRFGEFRLDPARHELWRGDDELSLRHKVFACIVYLIENRDRAVGRDELIEAIWGEVHLSDSVLGHAIRHARQALGDSGDDQHVIQTVRGFGYRWAVPVEVEESAEERAAPTVAETRNRRRRILGWALAAVLAVGALAAAAIYLRPRADSRDPAVPPLRPETGDIALLLPVTVETDADAEAEHGWARLGLMALISERLRAAGQAVVPSDTVIALLQGRTARPGADELRRLTAATGARLVLAARAQVTGTRWLISVHSLAGAQPPLSAVGESHDPLAAARLAADRLAASLGLTPAADEPEREPALQMLLQRIEAAALAQQMEVARALIEEADPALRRHPEVRFHRASLDFYGHRLDAAQAALEALLKEVPADRDRVFRARVLNRLAAVHATRGDRVTAEPLMQEAARLLEGLDTLPILAAIHVNLGNVAQEERADFTGARAHMAQARRIFEAIGDIDGLAALDFNVGILEARRERYVEARRYLESAAERRAAVHNVGGELTALSYMIEIDLLLLDPQTASTLVPRLDELLARTTNPGLISRANLSLAYLLDADGRLGAADSLLRETLALTEKHEDLDMPRMEALTELAEHRVRDGDTGGARRAARQVIAALADDPAGVYDDVRGRAWLALVRSRLTGDDLSGAEAAVTAMRAWADGGDTRATKIYAALASAELAAARGSHDAAGIAFERALALADRSRVPLRLLQVAESYVPWLLADGGKGRRDPGRALLVAERLADHADQHYDAALVRLRAYHALGPASAWRKALARVRSLAGERRIPPELESLPTG